MNYSKLPRILKKLLGVVVRRVEHSVWLHMVHYHQHNSPTGTEPLVSLASKNHDDIA